MKKKLPIFKTPEDRAKYLAAYEDMFDLWKVPHASIDVKTGYGSTHINVSGSFFTFYGFNFFLHYPIICYNLLVTATW